MINIPTTDIMTLITGDVDKAAIADGPQADEISFLGVMSAQDSGPVAPAPADVQAAVFGSLLSSDVTYSVENPEQGGAMPDVVAIIPAQSQKDALFGAPVQQPLANNGMFNPDQLVDTNPSIAAFASYNKDLRSSGPPALPKITPVEFGPDLNTELGKPMPLIAVEVSSPQVPKTTTYATTQMPDFAVTPHSFAHNSTPAAQADPVVSNNPLPRLAASNAKSPTPISLSDMLKPETGRLDKSISPWQFTDAGQSDQNPVERANQRPNPQPADPISDGVGLLSSQRATVPQPLHLPIAELPDHNTAPRTIPLGPATAEKGLATQADVPIVQPPPGRFSQTTPELFTSQKKSVLGAVPAPVNTPKQPATIDPSQTHQQHLDTAAGQPVQRPQIEPQLADSALQPLQKTTDAGPGNMPGNQQPTALRQSAPYGNTPHSPPSGEPAKVVAYETSGSPVTPSTIASNAAQPHETPKNAAVMTSHPPPAPKMTAFETTRLPAGFTAASLQGAHPQVTPAVAAPEITQPQAAPKAAEPEITQPPAAPKIELSKPIQPLEVPKGTVVSPDQPRAAAKVAALETNKIKTAVKSPAPTAVRPELPPQTGAPEINRSEVVDPLVTPELIPLETRSFDTAPLVRHDANLNRPEVMRHVAQQLTDAARQMPDRPVELALNPEELGRVRLTFTTTDAGLHVAVIAERGETMDLLRRHIESLAQDFRDLGYRDVKFDFSGNGTRSDANTSGNESADQDQNANPDAAAKDIGAPIQLSLEPSAGLDLRL